MKHIHALIAVLMFLLGGFIGTISPMVSPGEVMEDLKHERELEEIRSLIKDHNEAHFEEVDFIDADIIEARERWPRVGEIFNMDRYSGHNDGHQLESMYNEAMTYIMLTEPMSGDCEMTMPPYMPEYSREGGAEDKCKREIERVLKLVDEGFSFPSFEFSKNYDFMEQFRCEVIQERQGLDNLYR